jgi:Cu-Zn family superoxide dismutase
MNPRFRIFVVFAATIGLVLLSIAAAIAQSPNEKPKPVRMAPRETATPEAPQARAVARIEARSGSTLGGEAVFAQQGGNVVLTLTVENAPQGSLAVHLHEKGDCSAPDAMSAGPHWNPTGEMHGQWGHSPYHRGDIGNIEVGPDGKGTLTLTTDLWNIGGDPAGDIVGRSIVVHAKTDDFKTQPTGNAGGRIGCGVIAAGR